MRSTSQESRFSNVASDCQQIFLLYFFYICRFDICYEISKDEKSESVEKGNQLSDCQPTAHSFDVPAGFSVNRSAAIKVKKLTEQQTASIQEFTFTISSDSHKIWSILKALDSVVSGAMNLAKVKSPVVLFNRSVINILRMRGLDLLLSRNSGRSSSVQLVF